MNENENSKETLAAENIVLREELEEMRAREIQKLTDAVTEGERCTMLVNEVPEYLYSTEYQNGKIMATFHSPRCVEITGYTPLEYAENPFLWMDMIPQADRVRVLEFIQGLKEPLHCKSVEHRIIHKDGSIRWVLNMTTVHRDSRSGTLRQSGFLIDVTERRENEQQNQLVSNENRHQSMFDDLTGLYNRRGFRDLAEQQLRVAARIGQPVLLFFIDVDRLKQTNDDMGHHAGDKLLRDLAVILKATFRESDLIARVGGDEFTVLTMETGPDSKNMLSERLCANVKRKNLDISNKYGLSISAGVARYNLVESETVASLMDRADKEMYEIKRGKAGLCCDEK